MLQEGVSGKFGVGVATKCELYKRTSVIEDVVEVTADENRLVARPKSLTGAYKHT